MACLYIIVNNVLKQSVNNLIKILLSSYRRKCVRRIEIIHSYDLVEENKKLIKNPVNVFKTIDEDNLSVVSLNIYIAFRIILNVPVTNYESKPSFSASSTNKNEYRLYDGGIETDIYITKFFIGCDLVKNILFEKIMKNLLKQNLERWILNIDLLKMYV